MVNWWWLYKIQERLSNRFCFTAHVGLEEFALDSSKILIIRNRKELEAIRDSVWFWPRSLLTSENLRTKLTPTEYNILGSNCQLYNGMEEFFERMKAENWSKDQLREELIKESHNARYWPRHMIHKIMTPNTAGLTPRIDAQISVLRSSRTVVIHRRS